MQAAGDDMVKVWCRKRYSWRIVAVVIVFLSLLVSLPSRDGQSVFQLSGFPQPVVLQPSSEAVVAHASLTPDDQSNEAILHFARAQRALKQKRWHTAQTECERALSLAETFRFSQAGAAERAQHLKQFQSYHELYLTLLLQQAQGDFTGVWVGRAWEANERARWWRWQQTMQGLAGKRQVIAPLNGAYPLLNLVRQQLLNEETELLEYTLGETHSYLWRISRERMQVYELPRRAVIETAVARLRADLSTPDKAELSTPLSPRDSLREWLLPHLQEASSTLAHRWLIVTDGALQDVPFGLLAALPEPPEVATIPAAFALLQPPGHRSALPPAPNRVAVLADPVFGKHDERLAVANWDALTQQRRATNELSPMPRLPFARREGENLARRFWAFSTLRAFDFAANRELVMSGQLANYSIVHFATHGVLNASHPERSGLVLSQVNARGEAQAGLLQLRDICQMRLPAELVVLSACESNRLAEGFLYAGARRVLATLWPVNDAATSELMAHFYDALLTGDHFSPALALKHAQRSLSNNPRWKHPHYWAGFVLQGEW